MHCDVTQVTLLSQLHIVIAIGTFCSDIA